ncbi:hypothetical protein [Salipaludibacillus daqingensis]|uniref:hypothetical protein n=1 Tax=Salipaludibacillus daqingensis TaxID=3041001 RepID=UPI002473704B|nr:hypothetical protein [Salipaludibacillus daqingensis]
MNVEFKKIQTAMIVFLSLLFIGLLSYIFFVLQPLQQDVSNTRSELALEEEILSSMQSTDEVAKIYEEHEIQSLLRKVPVQPWIDHWMLDLEKAELVSDTEINRYTFSKGFLQSTSFAEEDLDDEREEISIDEEEIVVENEDESEVEVIRDEGNDEGEFEERSLVLADGEEVNQVTASLTVNADSYDQLFQFLYEIEQLDRFTEIYGLTFAAPAESSVIMQESEEEMEELTFDVNVSTYYIEDLLETFSDYEFSRPFVSPEKKDSPIFRQP